MALGTIISELIRIENGIEDVGDFIKKKLLKGKKRRIVLPRASLPRVSFFALVR